MPFFVAQTAIGCVTCGSVMLVRIARPKARGAFPAVVDVHGGAWILNDRNQNATFDDALATRGIVVAAPEFRKPPEGAYPVSIADIRRAEAAIGSRFPSFFSSTIEDCAARSAN